MTSQELIAKFNVALQDKWGYIEGTAGELWTESSQTKAASASGASSMLIKYGPKWIGHRVADCSGLFKWAYKELDDTIAHGSNAIARQYVVQLRNVVDVAMSDIKPGTAVFKVREPGKTGYALPAKYKQGGAAYNGDLNDYYHIGLYIGDGTVIEAKGTAYGVVTSKLSTWAVFAELKAVDYGETDPAPSPAEGTAIVNAKAVALRQGTTTSCPLLLRVPSGETVTILPPPSAWTYVEYQGKKGWMMTEFLTKGG